MENQEQLPSDRYFYFWLTVVDGCDFVAGVAVISIAAANFESYGTAAYESGDGVGLVGVEVDCNDLDGNSY